MPLDLPNLDTLKYDEIVQEAKLRLQTYCPEWTDYNHSDPGMALVQLYAWLTELMLYRMDQIPDKTYLSFLKVMNLERRSARPSKTQVVLKVESVAAPHIIALQQGTRFFATSDAGETLTFESLDPIDLTPYPLDMVQVFDGLNFEDYSRVNESETSYFRPLGWTPQVGSALYLGFHPDQKVLEEQTTSSLAAFPEKMVIHFFSPPSLNSKNSRSQEAQPSLVWEYASKLDRTDGDHKFDPFRWRPLTVIDDQTRSLTRDGRVVLFGPGTDCLATRSPKPLDDDRRFWIRCRLLRGSYQEEAIPEFSFIRSNVVTVENRVTVIQEAVGLCDGIQTRFQLQKSPIDRQSLHLVLQSSNGSQRECYARDDLFDSNPQDLHYQLNPNSGEIRFGDGKNGQIPSAGHTLVALTYRAGGGMQGNIRAGLIQDPPASVSGIESASNPRAAQGGQDEESLEELLKRAPRVLRGDGRAVTKEDYVRYAQDVPGVGRAIVLPQRLRQHPGLNIPGAVMVVVIPRFPRRDSTNPTAPPDFTPASELLDAVFERLEEVKPAGTEVDVVNPRHRHLELRVSVTPAPGISDNQAIVETRKVLEDYFCPVPNPATNAALTLTGNRGADAKPHWELETPIYPSRLYEVLFSARDSVSGARLIQDVAAVSLRNQGQPVPIDKALQLDRDELPYVNATIEITPRSPKGAS